MSDLYVTHKWQQWGEIVSRGRALDPLLALRAALML
jgi:hypothetical protein